MLFFHFHELIVSIHIFLEIFLKIFCSFPENLYICIAFEKNSLVAQLVRAADC